MRCLQVEWASACAGAAESGDRDERRERRLIGAALPASGEIWPKIGATSRSQ
jgi:hypothetical protein